MTPVSSSLRIRPLRAVALLAMLATPLDLAACNASQNDTTVHAEAPAATALPPTGASITVTLDRRNIPVDLTKVPHEGASIPLLAIWNVAFPGEAPAPLTFDLLGSDGFRPRSRSECKALLTGEEANRAHVDPVTHDVTFPDGKPLAGCYHVKALTEIDAVR